MSREEEILKDKKITSFSGIERDINKSTHKHTNAWGLVFIPLIILISLLYLIFS